MRDAEVDQPRFLPTGDDFHLMVDDGFRLAYELRAVARLAQGIGTHHAHRPLRQMIDQLSEAAQAVEPTLHRSVIEHPVFIDAGGELDLLAEPLEDAHLTVAGASQDHVKAVRAEIDGGDHRHGFGGWWAHGTVSVQNPDILT